MKTRPHKDDDVWKVVPVPPTTAASFAHLSAAELAGLLAAAYERIGALEERLGRAAA